jgi:hypothetical protein
VKEYQGVNPHTPKATPTLGDGVLVDSQNFRKQFQESKLNDLWHSLYHWKALKMLMSKMCLDCSFGHLKHKLWPKEGSGIKLPIWLLTRKKSGIDLIYFVSDRISIRGLLIKLWGFKVAKVPTGAISRLPLGGLGRKKPFGCGLRGQPQSIL